MKITTRKCTRCHVTKHYREYYFRRNQPKSICKECIKESARAYELRRKRKPCGRCGMKKRPCEFNARTGGTSDGLQSYCRECMRQTHGAENDVVIEPRRRQNICTECCNLPHRRDPGGCISCGLPYSEDVA